MKNADIICNVKDNVEKSEFNEIKPRSIENSSIPKFVAHPISKTESFLLN